MVGTIWSCVAPSSFSSVVMSSMRCPRPSSSLGRTPRFVQENAEAFARICFRTSRESSSEGVVMFTKVNLGAMPFALRQWEMCDRAFFSSLPIEYLSERHCVLSEVSSQLVLRRLFLPNSSKASCVRDQREVIRYSCKTCPNLQSPGENFAVAHACDRPST